MTAVPIILGALLFSWTCFLIYITTSWRRVEGTVVGKDEKYTGGDAPMVVYTIRYQSDGRTLEGQPRYAHISSHYKIGDKFDLILTPGNPDKFHIALNYFSILIYFLGSIFFFLLAVALYCYKK
jgi:ABC-type antimicrobial peptide transport system permease subunit